MLIHNNKQVVTVGWFHVSPNPEGCSFLGALLLYKGVNMQKPFLPIEEQIKLLESRGVVIDLNESPSLLLRYGYYSIINGYKDPFIDRQRSSELSNDFYKEGTKFSDIYRLFEFDLFLREILLKYLLRVEQMFKTVCTYTFAEFHMGNTYLNKESYCTEEQYSSIGLFNYETSLNKLIKKLKKISENRDSEYIAHYLDNYGFVPLWVLENAMTFGNMEFFYGLMKPEEQKKICKSICSFSNLPKYKRSRSPKQLKRSVNVLVAARNKCAHNERIYCTHFGKQGCNFNKLCNHMFLFLSDEDKQHFAGELGTLLAQYVAINSDSIDIANIMELHDIYTEVYKS